MSENYYHNNIQNIGERFDIANSNSLSEFNDIITGYKFHATFSWKTPLRILERHGEVHEGIEPPPCITDDMSQGIWVAMSKNWPTELGMSDDFIRRYEEIKSNATMASIFGQIPQNGGAYIDVLKCIRKIIESPVPPCKKRAWLEEYFNSETWRSCPNSSFLGERILLFEIPHFLDTIKGLRKSSKRLLIENDLKTPSKLIWAGVDNLAQINGIGSKMAMFLIESAIASKSRDEEFVCKIDVVEI